MVMDSSRDKRILDRIEEIDAAFRKSFRDEFKGTPSGQENVTDEEWAAFMEKRAEQEGKGWVIDPDGRPAFVDYFWLALGLSDGGAGLLRRYNRIRGRSD